MDWKEDFDQKQLLELLKQIKKKPGEVGGVFVSRGRSPISFHGGAVYEDLKSLLLTAAKFRLDIPHECKLFLLEDALYKVAETGDITPSRLKTEISKQEGIFENAPRSVYKLWSSLSIKYEPGLKLIRHQNNTLQFLREWPSELVSSHKWKQVCAAIGGEIPLNFTTIRVRVAARDGYEAVHIAFEFIDLLRGIWNFTLNRHRSWRMEMNAAPINNFRLGPGHFLDHESDPLSDAYWYEPSFWKLAVVYNAGGNWQKVRSHELKIRQKLSRSAYKMKLENAFRQYTRALDEHDKTVAFLKLWPVLEHLTGLSDRKRIDYGILVRRAAFLWPEYKYHCQVLQHLRHIRNRTIHSGISVSESEHVLFQLKRYVERLILYHLDRGNSVASFEEATSLLDLSPSKEALQNRVKKATAAIKLREEVEKRRPPKSTAE